MTDMVLRELRLEKVMVGNELGLPRRITHPCSGPQHPDPWLCEVLLSSARSFHLDAVSCRRTPRNNYHHVGLGSVRSIPELPSSSCRSFGPSSNSGHRTVAHLLLVIEVSLRNTFN